MMPIIPLNNFKMPAPILSSHHYAQNYVDIIFWPFCTLIGTLNVPVLQVCKQDEACHYITLCCANLMLTLILTITTARVLREM